MNQYNVDFAKLLRSESRLELKNNLVPFRKVRPLVVVCIGN